MSNLYILVFKSKEMVKIGKADILEDRIRQLTKVWGKPDLEESYFLEISKESVYKLEKSLHCLFHEDNIYLESGDGKTEFFNLRSLDYILSHIQLFLKHNSNESKIIKGYYNIEEIEVNYKRKVNELSYERSLIFNKRNYSKNSLKNIDQLLSTAKRYGSLLLRFKEIAKTEVKSYENGDVYVLCFRLEHLNNKLVTKLEIEDIKKQFTLEIESSKGVFHKSFIKNIMVSNSLAIFEFDFSNRFKFDLNCFLDYINEEMKSILDLF